MTRKISPVVVLIFLSSFLSEFSKTLSRDNGIRQELLLTAEHGKQLKLLTVGDAPIEDRVVVPCSVGHSQTSLKVSPSLFQQQRRQQHCKCWLRFLHALLPHWNRNLNLKRDCSPVTWKYLSGRVGVARGTCSSPVPT